MIPYDDLLAKTLPTINALVKYRMGNEFCPRWFVFGPTCEQLRRYAPDIFREVSNSQKDNLHLPHEGLDLGEAKELCRKRGSGVRTYYVIALPPEFDSFSAIPRDLQVFATGNPYGASPNLIAAALLGTVEPTMIAAPYSDFVSKESLEFRTEAMRELDRYNKYFPDWVSVFGRQSMSTVTTEQSRGCNPLLPSFVWCYASSDTLPETEPSDTGAVLGTGFWKSHNWSDALIPQPVHMRRLTQDFVDDIPKHDRRALELFEVATGTGMRGDDDSFVSLYAMVAEGYWGTDLARFTTRLRKARERLGRPVKQLSEICTSMIERRDWISNETAEDCVWCPLDGSHAGRPFRCAPNNTLANAIAQIRCQSAVDTEFLGRTLMDGVVQEDIRCRASGSLQHLILRPRVLGETLLPWPSPDLRQSTSAKFRRFHDVASRAHDEAQYLEELLADLETTLDSEAEFEPWSVPPRRIEDLWGPVISAYSDLDAELGRVLELMRPRDDVAAIERELHSAIVGRLKREHGDESWWHMSVPKKVRIEAVTAREERGCVAPRESYFYWLDLFKIISKDDNISIFFPTFEGVLAVQGKQQINVWFEKVNTVRNLLAHPVRGDISEEDRMFLSQTTRQIREVVDGLARS